MATNETLPETIPPIAPMSVTRDEIGRVVPTDAAEAFRIAKLLCEAKMVPDSYKTPQQVLIGIMKGMELGVPPITAVSWIMVINNRPAIWGDLAVALVQRSGKLAFFEERQTKREDGKWDAQCICERTDIGGREVVDFTWEDAVAADLTGKAIWKKYPKRMMQWRARAFALRNRFADMLQGLDIVEERAFVDGGTLVEVAPGKFEVGEEGRKNGQGGGLQAILARAEGRTAPALNGAPGALESRGEGEGSSEAGQGEAVMVASKELHNLLKAIEDAGDDEMAAREAIEAAKTEGELCEIEWKVVWGFFNAQFGIVADV